MKALIGEGPSRGLLHDYEPSCGGRGAAAADVGGGGDERVGMRGGGSQGGVVIMVTRL